MDSTIIIIIAKMGLKEASIFYYETDWYITIITYVYRYQIFSLKALSLSLHI